MKFKVGDVVKYEDEIWVVVDIDNDFYEDGSYYPYGMVKVDFLARLFNEMSFDRENGVKYFGDNVWGNRIYFSDEGMEKADLIVRSVNRV